MAEIVEVPLEITETDDIHVEQLVNEKIIQEEIHDIKSEITEIPQKEEKPKKVRGRPKGKAAPKPVQKVKAKKSKQVRYEEESDDELPEYIQPILAQREPPVDLASQMLKLLQNHAVLKQEKKRALYQSWFKRV